MSFWFFALAGRVNTLHGKESWPILPVYVLAWSAHLTNLRMFQVIEPGPSCGLFVTIWGRSLIILPLLHGTIMEETLCRSGFYFFM